jgi:glycosyltransferase involved in cell wall biosynthesis
MRILDVSPRVCFPPERGSSVRTYNLLRHLALRHQIRQFSQARWNGFGVRGATQEVQVSPSYLEWRYADPAASLLCEVSERAWVRAPVLSGIALRLRRPSLLLEFLRWADVVLVEFPWQFAFSREERPRGRVVLAAHNVEALKFPQYAQASGMKIRQGPWMRYIERAESSAVAGADLVLAVSSDDRISLIERYGADPSRVVVVPNGADTQMYRPADPDARLAAKRELGLPDRPTALFVSSDVPPNRDGLAWLRQLAALTKRYTFLVVGPISRPRVEGNVVFTGFVSDIGVYFRAADIALCPIRFGGGTKIKLLESLAAGLPAVALPESIQGLDVRHGEHLLIVDRSLTQWVATLERLADDAALARRLSSAASDFVRRHHDWRQIAEAMETALSRLV